VLWCVTHCESNTGDLSLVVMQLTLTELKSWLRTVASIDFCVFNVWPVVAGRFVNGYKGKEARDDARVGNLAKHEWVLVYAIDEATTAIPTSVLADINQIFEDNHGCVTKKERDAAMRQPEDFQDGEVWLMVKLGDTNPARLLVKRCLQKLDAEALEAEHTHICGGSDMDHMTKAQRLHLILDKLETNGTFKHQQAEWERQARTARNQSLVHDVCKTSIACSTLGSSAAMLTMVNSVKTLTKSVAVSLLDNQNRTHAGQGTSKCGLPAEFIDGDQMTLQELMSLKRMPHITLDGNRHNRHV